MTGAVTSAPQPGGKNWVSVEVQPERPLGWISVTNRNDQWQYFLDTYEVWAGESFGDYDSATSVKCGPTMTDHKTAVTKWSRCPEAAKSFVTVVHTPPKSFHFLSIAELNVYGMPIAPPPSPPPLARH